MENKLKLELKPKLSVALISTIFYSLFIVGIFSFYLVPMYITLRRTFDFSNVILLWIVFSIVFIALIFFFRYMNLKSRKYLFYNKEAVFYEGFLNIVQRTIPYEKVTDYILHKSVWDRMFGTGTIRLVTAGHLGGYGTHTVGGGVSIQYIENPDEVYNKLKSIIKNK